MNILKTNHTLSRYTPQVYPDGNINKTELTSYLFMAENVMQQYNILLCNLTFSIYGTKRMDVFIIKEQLGHILQAWFSSVLGVKGLPLIVCDMAFSKPNSESVRKKKSLLLFFLTMYCCSALCIFIQKGKYLLMLISLDFLGTI